MGRDRAADVAGELMRVDTEEGRLKAVWIWEFMLKHTSDPMLLAELSNVVAFPDGMPRLKQMAVVSQLANHLASSGDRIDVEHTEKYLEALELAFEEEPSDDDTSKRKRGIHKRKLSELTPDAGSESVWEGLQQPVLELKEDMQKLRSDDAKVKGKLSALVKKAWALFGPTFLEKSEAAVLDGKYNPEGVPLARQNVVRNEDVGDECAVELQRHVSRSTEELERARQALEESRVEMEKVVNDPLPALLRATKAAAEEPQPRSLNEPHPSAQAHVWDDEEIPENASPSASRRIHLPPIDSPDRSLRPRKDITSETSGKKRRQPKKWSEVEVMTLEREVAKYGKGNWKAILKNHKDVFHGRTEVDMKDKWRNIEKYGMRRMT